MAFLSIRRHSEGITKRESCGVGVEAPRIRRAKKCVVFRILVVVPPGDSRPLRCTLELHIGQRAVKGRPQSAKGLQRIQGRGISIHTHDAVAHVGGEPLNGLQQETGRPKVISIAVDLVQLEWCSALGISRAGSGISWNWGSRVLEANKSIRTHIVVVVGKLHSDPFVAIYRRGEAKVPGVSVVANLLDSVSCLVNISRCSKGDPANRLISDSCPVLLQAARADAGQEVVRRGQFSVKVGSQLVAGPEPHAYESGVEVDVNKVLGARDVAGSYVVGVVRVVVG